MAIPVSPTTRPDVDEDVRERLRTLPHWKVVGWTDQ